MAKDDRNEWNATSDHRLMGDGSAGKVMFGDTQLGELGYYNPPIMPTISIHDPSKVHPFTLGNWNSPIVTFHPDGAVEVHGDSYEAAKAFWDYVKQFAAAEYAKHAATHHEIRDLGEFVAERKGKE